jgi:16S rRNA processing protein RimM
MGFEDCYLIGQILKSHGVHGAVVAELYPANPSFIQDLESVFVEIHQKPVPFFINKLSFNSPGSAIIQFDDITTVDAARDLVNRQLYVLLTEVPKKIQQKFQTRELIGFNVVDEVAGSLGCITEVSEHAGQLVAQVDHNGNEVLFPLHADMVRKINRKKKELLVTLPDGLLEIYRQG